MSILDRSSFRAKILAAPACALGLFLAFGVLCWWMLTAQATRINVDLAGALHVLQTVQESERKLAESHNALYRVLSATRTNAKPEAVDAAAKGHQRLLAEAGMLLSERIDADSLDESGRGLLVRALAA